MIEPAQGNAKLREAVQICQGTLALNPREKSPQDWTGTQDNLGIALKEQGVRAEGPKATELLAQAVAVHRSILEAFTREQLPQDWARTQGNLGIALKEQGIRTAVFVSSAKPGSRHPGTITAFGLLAPVQSCFSKLLLRQYTHPKSLPAVACTPLLTVLFPYVKQRQG